MGYGPGGAPAVNPNDPDAERRRFLERVGAIPAQTTPPAPAPDWKPSRTKTRYAGVFDPSRTGMSQTPIDVEVEPHLAAPVIEPERAQTLHERLFGVAPTEEVPGA